MASPDPNRETAPKHGRPTVRGGGPPERAARRPARLQRALAALFVALVAGGLFSLREVSRATARLDHARKTLLASSVLMQLMADAETGQRGYLATRDARFLEPYEMARSTWRDRLAELDRLSRDSPAQQERLQRLRPLLDAKMGEMANTLRLRDAGITGQPLTNAMLAGKRRMDQLRAVVDELDAAEQSNLALGEENARASFTRALALSGAAALTLALLLGTFLVGRREEVARARRAVERAAVFDQAPTAIVVVSPSGRIVSVNARAEQLFGYAPAELVGQAVEAIIPTYARDKHVRLRHAYVDAPKARPMGAGHELYGLRKDGTEVPIEIGLAPIANEEGINVVASVIDISERKRFQEALESERRLLQAILAGVDDGYTVQSPAGDLVFVNNAGARMAGFASPEAMLATPIAEILDRFELRGEDGGPIPWDKLPGRAVLMGQPAEPLIAQYRSLPNDQLRWTQVRAYPVLDERGRLARVINVFRDITDEHRELARRRLLLGAVEHFNASLDYNTVLRSIAHEMVPALADWCSVDILDGESLERLAVEHVDPAKVKLVEDIERRYPSDPWAAGSPRAVMKSGHPFLLPVISEAMLRGAAKDDEHLRLLEALSLHSYLVVPMVGRAGPLGALTVAMAESQRGYAESDVAFVSALADRAAVAIENARLVRSLEATAAAEKRARDLVERMQSVVAAMSRAKTPAEVAEVACRTGAQAMRARAAHVWLTQDDGSQRLAATWPEDTTLVDLFQHIPAGSDAPTARVARSGQAEWVESEEDFARATPTIHATVKAAGRLSAFAAIPIAGAREPLGVLCIIHELPHAYDAVERAFHLALAQYSAQALERARLFEEERMGREQAQQIANFSQMFMGIASHDLRNPLSAISTAAELIRRTSQDERQRNTAVRIVRGAQRMGRMIDQLLDLTRIRVGKGLSLAPASVNLGELAQQIAEETESAHGCAIRVERTGDTSGVWDSDRLGQVFSNLLGNAAAHGKEGSPIVIEVDGGAPGAMNVVVRNEGEIPADILPEIFEPFRGSRQHGSTNGLGLGLYITREIVRAHGGTIDVSSAAGTTAFKMKLPRAVRHLEATAEA